jgi:hypothetical protein
MNHVSEKPAVEPPLPAPLNCFSAMPSSTPLELPFSSEPAIMLWICQAVASSMTVWRVFIARCRRKTTSPAEFSTRSR